MDIVLTRKGRELYAAGKFIPTYYAFCDDEIIYETEFVSASAGGIHRETQNRTSQRIKDVPRVKLQTGYQTAMGLKGHITSSLFEPKFRILGKSSNIDEEAPAWQIKVVNEKGLMSGSVKFVPTELSGAFVAAAARDVYKDANITDEQMLTKYNSEIIPQIRIFCDYEVEIADTMEHLLTTEEAASYKMVVEKAKNEKSIETDLALNNFRNMIIQKHGGDLVMLLKKSSDDILLDFAENNVDYADYNLEVYEYKYNQANDLVGLKQLKFSEEQHGTDFVEYFFDISTDEDANVDLQIEYVDESLFAGLEEEEGPSPQCAPGELVFPTATAVKLPLSAGSIPATPPPEVKEAIANPYAGAMKSCSGDGDCDPVAEKCKDGNCVNMFFGSPTQNVKECKPCKPSEDFNCEGFMVCVESNGNIIDANNTDKTKAGICKFLVKSFGTAEMMAKAGVKESNCK